MESFGENFLLFAGLYWLISALVLGAFGSDRTCGFFLVFLISVVLGPLVGGIVLLAHDRDDNLEYKKLMVSLAKGKIAEDQK